MKNVLRRTFLGCVLTAALGTGFLAATPLQVLRPGLAEMAAARGVLLPADARALRGQAALTEPDIRLDWRLAGVALSPAGLRFRIDLGGALSGAGVVLAGPFTQTIKVTDMSLRGAISRLVDTPLFLPSGEIEITLDHATIAARGGQLHAASGIVTWQDAVLRIEEPLSLGRVEGRISVPEPGILTLDLTNAGGDVRLNGRLRLDQAARVIDIDLLVKASPDTPNSVAAFLEARGVAEGDGTRISHRFPFP